jgi:hypothetical protein
MRDAKSEILANYGMVQVRVPDCRTIVKNTGWRFHNGLSP